MILSEEGNSARDVYERDSYCEAELKEIQGAEVMCPFGRKMQKPDDYKLGK